MRQQASALKEMSEFVRNVQIIWLSIQGDHLSGRPGNVREFDSCQGNVGDFTKSQGSVREKILSGKSGLKLFIVRLAAYLHPFLFLDLAELVHLILLSDHALLHSYPHH